MWKKNQIKRYIYRNFKNYLVKFFKGNFTITQLDVKEVKDFGTDKEHYGLFPEEIEENKNRNGKIIIKPQACGRSLSFNFFYIFMFIYFNIFIFKMFFYFFPALF